MVYKSNTLSLLVTNRSFIHMCAIRSIIIRKRPFFIPDLLLQVSSEVCCVSTATVESLTACNGVPGMRSGHPQAMLHCCYGKEVCSLQEDDSKRLVH